MKIGCGQPEADVRRPEDSGIVQQAVNVLIMAAVQDQEQEHHRGLTTVLVRTTKAGTVTMTLGPQWCSGDTRCDRPSCHRRPGHDIVRVAERDTERQPERRQIHEAECAEDY